MDISGWTLGGRDNAGVNLAAVVPGAVNSGTTMLAAGAYYVFGNTAVIGANQTIAANFLENDAEQISLWDGAFEVGNLIDGVVTEANKGAGAAATQYGTPSAAMLAQIGTGYRGNIQSGQVAGNGTPVLVSISRYVNGADSNNNGRDFGLRRATPGAANSVGTGSVYSGPNVDSATVGTEAAGLFATFVNPRVVDPTAVSTHNPSSIVASPQGGNAVTIWDPAFGGTGGGLDTVMVGGMGSFSMLVYLDPRLTTGLGDTEEWSLGLGGGSDPLHNNISVIGSANGNTGLAWAFRRDNGVRTLQLIDFGQGGPETSWVILGSVTLGDSDLGWHALGIDVNGTSVTGTFDNTIINGTTIAGLTGNLLYASYREGFAINTDPLLRPLTIDMIPEPTSALIGGIGLSIAIGSLRRRRK